MKFYIICVKYTLIIISHSLNLTCQYQSFTNYIRFKIKFTFQSEEYDEELTCLGLFKCETKILSATSKGKLYLFNWNEFGLHSDEVPSLTKKAINCMIPLTENVVVTGGEDGRLR